MIKRIFLSIAMLLVIAYLVLAITAFNVKPAGQACEDIVLVIKDSVNAGFITQKEVATILRQKKIYPVGEHMEGINTSALEDVLESHPLIDEVECYKTASNKVCVEVTQRVPILRVMGRNNENYYIDNKGTVLPTEAKCVAHLAVATGNIEKSFAMNELYNFAVFLQKNKFWNSQIEQINVLSGKEIELVPRVGDHIIFLGKIDNYEDKLNRLKKFYREGLNKVGWNKYERINLEFGNQIICTKRD